MRRSCLALVVFCLFAAPAPAAKLTILLPLGRNAYQTNEWIDVSIVRDVIQVPSVLGDSRRATSRMGTRTVRACGVSSPGLTHMSTMYRGCLDAPAPLLSECRESELRAKGCNDTAAVGACRLRRLRMTPSCT